MQEVDDPPDGHVRNKVLPVLSIEPVETVGTEYMHGRLKGRRPQVLHGCLVRVYLEA